jgi:hypothetical protein
MAGKITRKVARRITPMATAMTLAQVGLLAREHWLKLDADERRRVMALIARTRGRRRNLTSPERAELARLVAKSDPRLFAGVVAQRFSPVPLPRRAVQGKRRRVSR